MTAAVPTVGRQGADGGVPTPAGRAWRSGAVGAQDSLPAPEYVADDANPVPTLAPKPGCAVTARFGDDRWDLTAVVHRRGANYAIFDWGHAGTPHLRRIAKTLAYAKINDPAEGDARWKLSTAHTWLLCGFRRFASFMAEVGADRLDAVTPDMLDGYVTAVNAEPVHAVVRASAINVPRLLHLYRDRLPAGDAFGFEPFRGRRRRDLVADSGTAGSENATPRVPEAVMGPYLAWALRYVEVFAPEIEAALVQSRAEAATERARPPHPGGRGLPHEAKLAALTTYLERLRAEGRGLPGVDGSTARTEATKGWSDRRRATGDALAGVSLSRIAHAVFGASGGPYRWVVAHQDVLVPWRALLGTEGERARRDRPNSLAALLGEGLSPRTLVRELAMLQTACYVVIVYLSGLRDSEATSLRPGCIETTRRTDGAVHRHRIHGRLFKHRDEVGEPVTWVVIEPIVRAVEVLERLHAIFGAGSGTPLLSGADFAAPDGRTARPANRATNMNRFREHIGRLAIAAPDGVEVPPAVPLVDGAAWDFSPNQLRRTLAWYIVNQPFGMVAGAWQYKHAQIAVFEGYGGQRAYGFVDEVEREKLRRSLSLARELYEDRKAGRRSGAGGGAAALDRELDAIRDALGDGPGAAVEVDEARLLKRLRHVAIQLHSGLLNDCWYREELAACKPWQERPGQPTFARCEPHLCANSRIGPEHRPAWKTGYDNADALLRQRRTLPTNQTLVLEQDRARYERVLLALDRLIDAGDA